jgi:hypothetical protein
MWTEVVVTYVDVPPRRLLLEDESYKKKSRKDFPSRDSNRAPSAYKSEALQPNLTCLAGFGVVTFLLLLGIRVCLIRPVLNHSN